MGKMKQLWFTDVNKVELLEVDIPQVKANQVKVKIAYAALCATDVHQVTMGVLDAKQPMPLGHEASGVIEELSPEAEKAGYKVGDKVALYPTTSCGVCEQCKKGRTQYCINARTTGAFAEYVVTDISAIFKVPDDGNLAHYSLVEPANCTLRALDLAPIKHGATVAIAGIGGIGAIMLNMITLSGASKITAIAPVESKRKLALDLGAQNVIDPLNLYELYRKEGRIQTVFTTTSIMPRTINIIPRLQMDKIIGKVIPLSDAVEGFELFKKSIYPKILLDCSK